MIIILGLPRMATAAVYNAVIDHVNPKFTLYEPFTYLGDRRQIIHDILCVVRDDTYRLPGDLPQLILENQRWLLDYAKYKTKVPYCGPYCEKIISKLKSIDSVLVKDVYLWLKVLNEPSLVQCSTVIFMLRDFDSWLSAMFEWYRNARPINRLRKILKKIIDTYIRRKVKPVSKNITSRIQGALHSLSPFWARPDVLFGMAVAYTYLTEKVPRLVTARKFVEICKHVYEWYYSRLTNMLNDGVNVEIPDGKVTICRNNMMETTIVIVRFRDKLSSASLDALCSLIL